MERPEGSSRPAPRVLGRYALYDKIASGGMASVHLARLVGPVGFSRMVAIKRLHPHYAADAEFVSMLLDEARVAARIHHPNVVPTLDVVADEGELFLVMEYVQGESLNKLLGAVVASGAFVEPRIASAVAIDLLNGLQAAHEATSEGGESLGIVHRDVSPHNVIVGVDGMARVLDFGIAKAVSRLQTTREGQLKGKLAYMSPEQMLGVEVDARTDVYAAAVVLWETLTALRLFRADSDTELLARVHGGVIEPPSACMEDAARQRLSAPTLARLDAIVMKGLARKASDRYASAREMVTALEECVPPAPKGQVGEWVKRLAKTALEKRSASLAEIESDVSLTPTPLPAELMQSIQAPRETPSRPRAPDSGSLAANGSQRQAPSTAPNMAIPPSSRVGLVRPGRMAAIVGAVALLALGATVLAPRFLRQDESGPVEVPAVASAAPHALTDFPPPQSSSPEALAAYATGLQQLRDASEISALASFAHAVALDPGLAAAHLRRAIVASLFSGDDITAHESYSQAVQHRDNLPDRDKALLDVLEPYLQRDPSDLDETEKRATGLSALRPDDSEAAFYAALFHYSRGRHAQAIDDFERAVRSDPRFALALSYEVSARAYVGDISGAKSTVERCLAASPLGTQCIFSRYLLDADQGACQAEEADAKAWIARDPSDYYGYWVLALALAAQGRPVEAVRAAVDQKWKHLGSARKWREALDQSRLDVLDGDFARAEGRLRDVLDSPDATDTSAASHAMPAALLVDIYRETGRMPAARKVAEQFLKQSDVWVTPHLADDLVISNDAVPRMLATLRDTGALTAPAFEQRRRLWLEHWQGKAAGLYLRTLWVYGHAWTVETPEQATAALAVLPDFEPLPTFAPMEIGSVFVGRTYLKGGRLEDAVDTLRKATAACTTLLQPIEHTRGYADLGAALEQKGDVAGACAAYQAVLARWGDPKPRSVTAATARGRIKALRCAP
jgi:serine/threonine protein kinase/tetratricopeptide (TPR) repeat protein